MWPSALTPASVGSTYKGIQLCGQYVEAGVGRKKLMGFRYERKWLTFIKLVSTVLGALSDHVFSAFEPGCERKR